MNRKVFAGKLRKIDYDTIPLQAIVGKTVEALAKTSVDGPVGDEPCIMLFFTDGTKHGFVLPPEVS